jgi:hypothetical protein
MLSEKLENRRLNTVSVLGKLLNSKGITTWSELTKFIHNLPYGRNSKREDFTLVLSEGKGTCSSKHAFLKLVANENGWDDIELILAMVKINATNTPIISRMLKNRDLDYFPEAHCYLKYGDERMDYTFPNTNEFNFNDDLLVERIIQPNSVIEFKINFHISYMKQWCSIHDHSFDRIWLLREKYIRRLSQ